MYFELGMDIGGGGPPRPLWELLLSRVVWKVPGCWRLLTPLSSSSASATTGALAASTPSSPV
ncbi:hypothetical protein Hdeb2414_s0001g00031071 [Helianthus debilis subsp. tardiflorus]